MKVEWKIFKEKIGTDNCVAIITKEDGTPILRVYEGRSSHFTRPCEPFTFIDGMQIPYTQETQRLKEYYRKQLETFSTDEIMLKRLEFACQSIKDNVMDQINRLLNLLS